MKNIQWLLIGGVAHGKTLWIKGGNSVNFPIENSFAVQQYVGENYVHDGQLYRIGLHNPTIEEVKKIPLLITEVKLEPLS
jgi:hypothetical protein